MTLDLQEFSKNTPTIVREDILPENQAFLLHGFLTPEECQSLISQSESACYEALNLRYRTNDRVLIPNDDLATLCMERIAPFLPDTRDITSEESDQLWGNQGPWLKEKNATLRACAHSFDCGSWTRSHMNNFWRFCRYEEGGYFKPHRDGCKIDSPTSRSLFTVNIYLNDTDGGATQFLEHDRKTPYFAVQPRAGTALVFVHWLLHEGAALDSGQKYLMRSDVMYERSSPGESMGNAFAYIKMAENLESEGHPMKSVEFYKKGIKAYPPLETFL